MNKNRRIKRKIDKIYKPPINNLYSHRFYSDLFSGYEYSLNEDKVNSRDFYKITPSNKEMDKLFKRYTSNDFTYKFGQIINSVLYSLAVYDKAYIFLKPEFIEKTDNNGNTNKIINTLQIKEVKGIPVRNRFYYKTFSDEILEFNICEGTLITFHLKEIGFKKNYFTNLVKQLGKYDILYNSTKLITNEPSYDFNVHKDKYTKKFLRKVKDIGWCIDKNGLSDSYILYKEIQMKLFKMRMLQYILKKINQALAENYIPNKEFKIQALTGNINYEDLWVKFQCGELTTSELSKIILK